MIAHAHVLYLASICAAILLGCQHANDDWASTQASGSIHAYRSFLHRHGDSRYAAEATRRLETLLLRDVEELGTLDAFDEYLRSFPLGAHASQVAALRHELVDRRDWGAASDAHTIPGYEEYLASHPSGLYMRECQLVLEALRDTLDWDAAQAASSIATVSTYLERHPKGMHVYEASTQLETLRERELEDGRIRRVHGYLAVIAETVDAQAEEWQRYEAALEELRNRPFPSKDAPSRPGPSLFPDRPRDPTGNRFDAAVKGVYAECIAPFMSADTAVDPPEDKLGALLAQAVRRKEPLLVAIAPASAASQNGLHEWTVILAEIAGLDCAHVYENIHVNAGPSEHWYDGDSRFTRSDSLYVLEELRPLGPIGALQSYRVRETVSSRFGTKWTGKYWECSYLYSWEAPRRGTCSLHWQPRAQTFIE